MRGVDLTGRRIGRLTATGDWEIRKGRRYWRCVCVCGGKEIWVQTANLTSGATTSCGCFHRERMLKHGHLVGRRSPTYSSWQLMLTRCRNPNRCGAHLYVKRGITVCERWKQFENFLADMGEQPPKMTLERINNDLGYFKENCRWATRAEQARNTCRTKLTYDMAVQIALRQMRGEKCSVIAKDYAVSKETVSGIVHDGKRWKGARIDAAFIFDLEQEPEAST